MQEPNPIGYGTEPVDDYNRGLDAAATPEELRRFLSGWPTLAPDAIKAAKNIGITDWPEWRRGLESERRGKFAGESWARRYGAITMPARMLRASMVAEQFMVPWGLAWKRLIEEGVLDA